MTTRRERRDWAAKKRREQEAAEKGIATDRPVREPENQELWTDEERAEFERHSIEVDGEVIDDRPPPMQEVKEHRVRYTGRGSDIRMVCAAITQNWSIPERTWTRIIDSFTNAMKRPDLPEATLIKITNCLTRMSMLKLQGARLELAAELAGLHATVVDAESVQAVQKEEAESRAAYRRLLEKCATLEELETVKRVSQRSK